ncbi:MAG TPA: JAB domain-containing protein [Candidatus Saccharimonadales bacterium]
MTVEQTMVPLYHLELVRERDIEYKDVLPIENAAAVFHSMLDSSPVEKLAVIHTNTQMKMIGAEIVAIGSLEKVSAQMCDIFKGAIQNNAYSIWLAHNHVDGNVQASSQDYLFTQRVIEASRLLGVALYDHLVIAPGKCFSIWNHQEEMIKYTCKPPSNVQSTASDKALLDKFSGKSLKELEEYMSNMFGLPKV